jgi:hypothetical protein
MAESKGIRVGEYALSVYQEQGGAGVKELERKCPARLSWVT